MKFFFDTYALVEIFKGSKNYEKYADAESFTSILNLFEFYTYLLRFANEETAKKNYYRLLSFVISFSDEDLFEAARLKLQNNKLSYVDAIGYVLAAKNNLKFLTGDREFKDMKNVELVR